MTDDKPQSGWRYKLGLVMFIVPFVMFFGAPLAIPLLGLSAGQTAGLIGGIVIAAEVIWFASIPLLGVKGFKAVKAKAFGWLKLKQGPISERRHQIGVTMFFASLVLEAVAAGFIVYAFFSTSDDPAQFSVFGMGLNEAATMFVGAQIVLGIVFVASFFVLGGDFWERVRVAFTWTPDSSGA